MEEKWAPDQQLVLEAETAGSTRKRDTDASPPPHQIVANMSTDKIDTFLEWDDEMMPKALGEGSEKRFNTHTPSHWEGSLTPIFF